MSLTANSYKQFQPRDLASNKQRTPLLCHCCSLSITTLGSRPSRKSWSLAIPRCLTPHRRGIEYPASSCPHTTHASLSVNNECIPADLDMACAAHSRSAALLRRTEADLSRNSKAAKGDLLKLRAKRGAAAVESAGAGDGHLVENCFRYRQHPAAPQNGS